jgi:uncharacterized membrane protein
VVRVRRLWPRSLNPPPLTDADLRSYELYAGAQQRSKEIEVVTRPAAREEVPPAGTEQQAKQDAEQHSEQDARKGAEARPARAVPEPRAGHRHRQRRSSLRQYATRATHRLRRG